MERKITPFWCFEGVKTDCCFRMCCIAILALTVCYPGIFFKSMNVQLKTGEKRVDSDASEVEVAQV